MKPQNHKTEELSFQASIKYLRYKQEPEWDRFVHVAFNIEKAYQELIWH